MDSIQLQIQALVKQANAPNPFDYVRQAVANDTIAKLNNDIFQCNRCNFCTKHRTLGAGSTEASIMVISDCATSDQMYLDKTILAPYEGVPEKQIFDVLFDALQVDANKLFWMNVVNCCPSRMENEQIIYTAPNTQAINNCAEYVKRAVKVLDPKMVILMGNVSLNCFIKNSISKAHGQWTTAYTVPAMPVYSPTYIRNAAGRIDNNRLEQMKTDMVNDLWRAFQWFISQYPNINISKQ